MRRDVGGARPRRLYLRNGRSDRPRHLGGFHLRQPRINRRSEERLLREQAEYEDECRNWRQDKKLTDRELKDAGLDAHDLKKRGQRHTDIFKDREGNLYEKPKNGKGPGDPLGINIKDLLP